MNPAMRFSYVLGVLGALAALPLCGCGGHLLPATEGVNGRAYVDGGGTLESMRLKPQVCADVDMKPDYATLDERSLEAFIKARGLPARIVKARSDLVYVELQLNPDKDTWVRMRVATLQSPPQAAEELHKGILEHGPGWWGVHRANLAVLVWDGSVDDILAFNVKTKLACWGVLTIAGRDDVFVVPGGYREL
jgi:hypothetical protein